MCSLLRPEGSDVAAHMQPALASLHVCGHASVALYCSACSCVFLLCLPFMQILAQEPLHIISSPLYVKNSAADGSGPDKPRGVATHGGWA